MQHLQNALSEARTQVDGNAAILAGQHFIGGHRDQWLAPLLQEQSTASNWSDLVSSAMSRAEDQYARDYLNNPDKYETFNRALTELLTLLEVPGLAATLTRTRQQVTWPARKLLGLGRDALGTQFEDARSKTTVKQEAETLQQVLDSTLISLQGALLDQPQQQAFWRTMTQAIGRREPQIRQNFLAESALGKYLDTIKAELKESQRQHVNVRLLQGLLTKELRRLSLSYLRKDCLHSCLNPNCRAYYWSS